MIQVLTTIAREIVGLFVDDGLFAAAIVGWLVIAGLILRDTVLAGPLLFVGLAVILVASAVRRAGR